MSDRWHIWEIYPGMKAWLYHEYDGRILSILDNRFAQNDNNLLIEIFSRKRINRTSKLMSKLRYFLPNCEVTHYRTKYIYAFGDERVKSPHNLIIRLNRKKDKNEELNGRTKE